MTAVAGLEAVLPPRDLLGSWHAPSDLSQLSSWVQAKLAELKPAALFVCLDAILYGGLVASRRSDHSFGDVNERIRNIARWKEIAGSELQIFAQSSVMRVPHYNGATGEPDYWRQYGEKIYRWSVLMHKDRAGLSPSQAEFSESQNAIPQAVREDFLNRRRRNFQINQNLIDCVNAGFIDYLVFSQDDTNEFGLNVWEKSQLIAQAKALGLSNVVACPGTDEVMMTMIARWLVDQSAQKPRVSMRFSPDCGGQAISNFEGQTIAASLTAQANVCGLEMQVAAEQLAEDFAILVHTAGDRQGDHIALPGTEQALSLNTETEVITTLHLLEKAAVPVVLCDVAYANGADPLLVEALLKREDLLAKLSAYAGWNTTGNTIGSALSLGVAAWYGKLHDYSNSAAIKRALFVRLGDDWAYQAVTRSQLAGSLAQERLEQLITPLLLRLANALKFDSGGIAVRLPWNRTFEVEIDLVAKTGQSSPVNSVIERGE